MFLQELVKNPDVLAAFLTGHSPIIFSLFSKSEGKRGKGLWKYNNSLCEKGTYINSMKKIRKLIKEADSLTKLKLTKVTH